MANNSVQWAQSAFSSFFTRRLTPPITYASSHTGKTYQCGQCYDAAGNLLEEAVDSEPLLGEIMLFVGNYVPLGFLACDGSLLPIAQYQLLFTLIGTTYGGDGQVTFALPDLRGRIPIGAGQGSGLSSRTVGETGGRETVTVTAANLPSTTKIASPLIKNRAVGTMASGFETGRVDGTKVVTVTGGGQAHNNMTPFLALQYCIAVEGISPSRN